MAQALGELGEIALEVGEFEHLAEGESVRRPYQPVPGERGPGAAGTPRIFWISSPFDGHERHAGRH
jgi:hypothetical protein